MKKILLAGCLWPALINAQEVKPVLSDDYRSLIYKDSSVFKRRDSTNSLNMAPLKYNGYPFKNQYLVKRIRIIHNNTLQLNEVNTHYLKFSGSFFSDIESKRHNRIPLLQEQYAQGRSGNGTLRWQGPETGELFSYGPAMNSLEYDGSNYAYDLNGRLTAAGTGNGNPARIYNNSVLRPATGISNNLVFNTRYQQSYSNYLSVCFKAGQHYEKTMLVRNKNKAENYGVTAEGKYNKTSLNTGFTFLGEKFDHSNRNGYLNRVYMNSLLSPVSFSNSQGLMTGNQQRAYSHYADNPFFLLENEQQGEVQKQQHIYLNLETYTRKLKFKLNQSVEKNRQQNEESYAPGTAFFPAGMPVNRNNSDHNYQLRGEIVYTVPFTSYKFNAQLTGVYQYSDKRSTINYNNAASLYRYQRRAHDASFSFQPVYRANKSESGITLNNKFYASNTSASNHFWLPNITAFHWIREIFGNYRLNLKFTASYNRFDNEVPVNQSFATTGLIQQNPALAGQFLPMTEVKSFNGLAPVEHREYLAGLEIQFNKIQFSANSFYRKISNDIFPYYQGNELILENIASHYNRGTELQIEINPNLYGLEKVIVGGGISFITWKSLVTGIKNGFDRLPLFGFSNVHKALVKGEPLGVIMGSSWLRDAGNNMIIGSDGFPLVDNQLKVLGNPLPDFIMKFSQKLRYKKWDAYVDWEWKKGGDMWNGTAAMLDYYGRSASTGKERHIVNYVFDGVQANGGHNNIPVNFYDPSQPFAQNRWVRYGAAGVTEAYIQKADMLRISMISVSWKTQVKKYLQQLTMSVYVNNLLIWSPYKGSDPNQLLYDQYGSQGLDFFNLPAMRTAGFKMAIQF